MPPALLLAGALVLLVFLRRADRRANLTALVGSLAWPAAPGAVTNETARGQIPDPMGSLPPGTVVYDPASGEYLT